MTRFLFIALIVLVFMGTPSAYAQEKLLFNNQIVPRQEMMLNAYLKPLSDYTIAKVDLNYDGIFEFVAQNKNCGLVREMCDFQVLAEDQPGEKIITLGSFRAYDIVGGKGSAFGVRDLWVYESELNDFSHTIYRWNAEKGLYEMTEKGK